MSQPSWTEKLVTVGIATWNSEDYLPTCLDGLAAQAYPSLEFIIVDNGSADRSVDLVRQRLPEATIFQNAGNEGYCRAHNRAIGTSHGEFYLALNPDVRMLPGFIEHLVAALEAQPECGSATGKLWRPGEHEPKILDAAGLFIDRHRHQYLRGHGEEDAAQYDGAEEVFGADGAAPLHRRETLEATKMLGEYYDESFFAYMEDVDLAWRARLLGWKCRYEPNAVAYHERSFLPGKRRSMSRKLRRIAVKNRYLTIIKNEGKECWRRDWWRMVGYDLGILLYMLLFEQTSLPAYFLLQRQLARAIAWRQAIWERVRVLPEDRLAWFS